MEVFEIYQENPLDSLSPLRMNETGMTKILRLRLESNSWLPSRMSLWATGRLAESSFLYEKFTCAILCKFEDKFTICKDYN